MRPLFDMERARRLFLVTAVAWATVSLLSLATPDPERYLDAAMLVPVGLTAVAVMGLRELHRKRLGRFAMVAALFAVLGSTGVFVRQVGLAFEIGFLETLGFPFGVLVWAIGLAVLGVGVARAGVLPAWCGLLLVFAQPTALAFGLLFSPISGLHDSGDYTGAIGHGIAWFAMAAALRANGGRIATREAIRASSL